jgi:hypothetical protein
VSYKTRQAAQRARLQARAEKPISVKGAVLQVGLNRAHQARKEGASADQCLEILKDFASIADSCGDEQV